MSSTGVAPAPIPNSNVNQAAVEQKLRLQAKVRNGAGWLMAVAIFSVINSVLVLSNANLHFIVGLGVTQIADGVGKSTGSTGAAAGVIVSLFMAGIFALFWKFARQGQQWAFITGMVIYALDGLIFLGLGVFLDFAFHLYALYCIFLGLKALTQLQKLNAQKPTFAVSSTIGQ